MVQGTVQLRKKWKAPYNINVVEILIYAGICYDFLLIHQTASGIYLKWYSDMLYMHAYFVC